LDLTSNYEELLYFRIFDKSLNKILEIIESLMNKHADKQFQTVAMESYSGSKIISNVAFILQ